MTLYSCFQPSSLTPHTATLDVFFFSMHIFLLVVLQKGLSAVKLPVDEKIQSTGRVGELFWRGDMHSFIVDLDPNWAEFEITSGIYTGKILMQF